MSLRYIFRAPALIVRHGVKEKIMTVWRRRIAEEPLYLLHNVSITLFETILVAAGDRHEGFNHLPLILNLFSAV